MDRVSIENDCFVASVNGMGCQSREDALREIGRALLFPSYYGQNLDALEECLADLSWIQNQRIVFIINGADEFLQQEAIEVKDLFLDILAEASDKLAKSSDSGKKEFVLFKTSGSPT